MGHCKSGFSSNNTVGAFADTNILEDFNHRIIKTKGGISCYNIVVN